RRDRAPAARVSAGIDHRRGPRRPPPSLPQNRIAPAKPALEGRYSDEPAALQHASPPSPRRASASPTPRMAYYRSVSRPDACLDKITRGERIESSEEMTEE